MAQYDMRFDRNSKVGEADINIKELWSQTLPGLLLAPSEEEFDRILEEFVAKREELGFALVMEESTRQMRETKEKLSIQ
jgi:putative aldouronate transport system substrate-binding protein